MKKRKPIILIPGIQGTKLFNTNEKDFNVVWSGLKKNFSNIQKLALQKDGKSDKEIEIVVERADVENLAYSEIINYLRSLGFRVFIFGYDWRKSNMDSGVKLEEYVLRLKDKLNVDSFNFITHSMGALVLSSYFKRIGEQGIKNITNRVIFTVPPFLGSAEATFNLVIGKSRLFNSSDDFRKIARTFPAIYELLPVYKGAYLFEDAKKQAHLNYFDYATYWQQIPNPTRKDTISKQKLISDRLSFFGTVRNENNFIYDFSNLKDEELRSRFLVLAGTGEKTRTTIKIKDNWKHYINLFDFKTDTAEGDGTVPFESAIAFKDILKTLSVESRPIETWADSFFIMKDWHAFFLNNGRVQNIITRFFKPHKNEMELMNKTNNLAWFMSIADDTVKVIK